MIVIDAETGEPFDEPGDLVEEDVTHPESLTLAENLPAIEIVPETLEQDTLEVVKFAYTNQETQTEEDLDIDADSTASWLFVVQCVEVHCHEEGSSCHQTQLVLQVGDVAQGWCSRLQH